MTTHQVLDRLLIRIPTAAPDTKVRQVIAHLTDKKHGFECVSYIYVLKNRKLVGVVSIKELLQARSDAALASVMQDNIVSVPPHATAKLAATVAIQHGIKAVPVIEQDGTFRGVVGTDVILHTLHRKHVEDLLRFGGIGIAEKKYIIGMLSDKVAHLLRIRTPWLILGLAGGGLATIIVSLFERALSSTVALAFFIPVIVYMSDAVGTQTQTLFIRALAVQKISLRRYVIKEFLVDSVLGVVLGLIIAGFAFLWNHGGMIGVVVGISMAINVVLAGAVAILISWALYASKRDPALGAGPFATVIQDILSIVVYFAVASVLL